jgi:excisionase family DNA binding protein
MGKEESAELVDREFMRVRAICEDLDISRSKGYELVASGEIPSVRIAGCLRVRRRDYRAWRDRQLQAQTRS